MAKHGEGYLYGSVTQILGVLRKMGLEMWFKYNTPEFIKRESEKGKQIGTETHDIIEKCINGEEMKLDTQYPDEIKNSVNSFLLFQKENPQYILKKSEIILNVDEHKYSGKLDCLCEENGNLIIADWKTGKSKNGKLKFYDEMIFQISAYVTGYNLQFEKQVKKAVIILLDKTAINYAVREVGEAEIKESFNEVFLPCVQIWNYSRRKKK